MGPSLACMVPTPGAQTPSATTFQVHCSCRASPATLCLPPPPRPTLQPPLPQRPPPPPPSHTHAQPPPRRTPPPHADMVISGTRVYLRAWYSNALLWLRRKGGPTWRVDHVFLWNLNSWDIQVGWRGGGGCSRLHTLWMVGRV